MPDAAGQGALVPAVQRFVAHATPPIDVDADDDWMWSVLPDVVPPAPPGTQAILPNPSGFPAEPSRSSDGLQSVDPYWEHIFAIAPKLCRFDHRHVLSIRHPRQSYWRWSGAARPPLRDLTDPSMDEESRWNELADAHERTVTRDYQELRRASILASDEFQAVCKRWWAKLYQADPEAGRSRGWPPVLTRSAYSYGEARLYAELLGKDAEFLFVDAMLDDFMLDCDGSGQGVGVTFEKYTVGLFELADTWTSTLEEEEYVALLAELLVRCFPVHKHLPMDDEMHAVRRVVVLNSWDQQKMIEDWEQQQKLKRTQRSANYTAVASEQLKFQMNPLTHSEEGVKQQVGRKDPRRGRPTREAVPGAAHKLSMTVYGAATRPARDECLRNAQIAHWHGFSRISQRSAVLGRQGSQRAAGDHGPCIKGAWRPQRRGDIVSRAKGSKLHPAALPQASGAEHVAALSEGVATGLACPYTLPSLPQPPAPPPDAVRLLPRPPSSRHRVVPEDLRDAVLSVVPPPSLPLGAPPSSAGSRRGVGSARPPRARQLGILANS